jgi:hypothetical protein
MKKICLDQNLSASMTSEQNTTKESLNNVPTSDGHFLELIDEETTEEERIEGIIVGEIVSINNSGKIFVNFPENPIQKELSARSTVSFSKDDIGSEVALMFEGGDIRKPIIIGPMHQQDQSRRNILNNIAIDGDKEIDAHIDGKKITLNARKEIVFSCGKASITLTQAGKILIRGKYILSRSTGVNRLKGGSIQLN